MGLFKPKSVHFGDLGLDLGIFGLILTLNWSVWGIWDWILANLRGPRPGFGHF